MNTGCLLMFKYQFDPVRISTVNVVTVCLNDLDSVCHGRTGQGKPSWR